MRALASPGPDVDRRPRPERRPAGPDRDRARARPAARRHRHAGPVRRARAPAGATGRPTRPTRPPQAIARAAVRSTVRVSARTCQFHSSGSGFASAAGYVVTNAHVVAGASSDPGRLRRTAGSVRRGRRSSTTPSSTWPSSGSRGSSTARCGSPAADPDAGRDRGDDRLPARRAARPSPGRPSPAPTSPRAATSTASSASAAGSSSCARSIDQGDSGGPLILADGTVGGVVFAEARTDETSATP